MEIETNRLSINDPLPTCRDCKISCCTDNAIGKLVFPPFLTLFDIQRMHRGCKVVKNNSEFFEEHQNPVTGNTLTIVKHLKGRGCVFFNHEVKRCGIFEVRPLDCRLFPLDITKIGNKYVWMLHNQCRLPEDIIPGLLESAKKEILPYLRDYLPDYSTIPMKLTDQEDYVVLDLLNF